MNTVIVILTILTVINTILLFIMNVGLKEVMNLVDHQEQQNKQENKPRKTKHNERDFYKQVTVLDANNRAHSYKNISIAAKKLNMTYHQVYHCINKERPTKSGMKIAYSYKIWWKK